ncbi:MAG: adaptor protein MecA [Clostridia bacterium]|nr:adaptor protein MecA [Clostridia bacterium]
MRINTIDENKIEIYLSGGEIRDIFGEYALIDYDDPECRIKIHSLFAATASEIIFPLDCNRVFIEVKPVNTGCVISYTKIYTNTREEKTYVFVFSNSENLISSIDALKALDSLSSELYINGEKYALIVKARNVNTNDMLHIGEYCKISQNKSDAVRIREYWQAVCKKGAILRLTNAFLR